MRLVRRVFRTYAPFKPTVKVALLIMALTSIIALVPPYLQGRVIDSLRINLFWKTLIFIALTSITLFMVEMGEVYRGLFENKKLDYAIDRFTSKLTMEKVLSFSLSQLLNQNSGITQSIIHKGKHAMNAIVYMMLFDILPVVSEIVIVGVILMALDPLLGIITVVGIGTLIYVMVRFNLNIQKPLNEIEDRFHTDDKLQSEVLRNVSLVLSSAQEERAIHECDESVKRTGEMAQSLWDGYIKRVTWYSVIRLVTFSAVTILSAWFVSTGKYSVGHMVMIWSWFFRIQSNASRIGRLQRQVMKLYTSVAKYFEMLDIVPEVQVMPNAIKPGKFEGRIEFRNVTMRYRTRPYIVDKDKEEKVVDPKTMSKDPALLDVSFTVNPGERVAIVGESGAGKTSIVHALLRAQDPDEGQVVIDGHDLRELDLRHFRESVGLVEQHVPLFDRSLRYNITYGLNGKSEIVTDQELTEIAKMSCIDRFMANLTNGFDTAIGERGIRLSGGERQRVGIARALIKRPPILIFDEATSNLDPNNELLIREAIEQASLGRTTIIIAHRFSTIRNVDKVIVLDKGKVVGIGSHNELALACEHYQRLIRPQVGMARTAVN